MNRKLVMVLAAAALFSGCTREQWQQIANHMLDRVRVDGRPRNWRGPAVVELVDADVEPGHVMPELVHEEEDHFLVVEEQRRLPQKVPEVRSVVDQSLSRELGRISVPPDDATSTGRVVRQEAVGGDRD